MFFILSKLLVFLIRPLTWLFGLLIYALLTNVVQRRRRALGAALMVLALFTNRPLFNVAVAWWEPHTISSLDVREPYDIAILLGGYSQLPPEGYTDQYLLSERGNRFVNTYELYCRGKVRRILLTGGAGSLWRQRPNESQEAARFLQVLGVPAEKIIIEDRSRNTQENALLSSQLIREQYPGARCLLITSAWHLPRARRCFERMGLKVTPYATDPLRQPFEWNLNWLLVPRSELLAQWELIIKEWVGIVAYRLAGYA